MHDLWGWQLSNAYTPRAIVIYLYRVRSRLIGIHAQHKHIRVCINSALLGAVRHLAAAAPTRRACPPDCISGTASADQRREQIVARDEKYKCVQARFFEAVSGLGMAKRENIAFEGFSTFTFSDN
jgi:hypothetical protein